LFVSVDLSRALGLQRCIAEGSRARTSSPRSTISAVRTRRISLADRPQGPTSPIPQPTEQPTQAVRLLRAEVRPLSRRSNRDRRVWSAPGRFAVGPELNHPAREIRIRRYRGRGRRNGCAPLLVQDHVKALENRVFASRVTGGREACRFARVPLREIAIVLLYLAHSLTTYRQDFADSWGRCVVEPPACRVGLARSPLVPKGDTDVRFPSPFAEARCPCLRFETPAGTDLLICHVTPSPFAEDRAAIGITARPTVVPATTVIEEKLLISALIYYVRVLHRVASFEWPSPGRPLPDEFDAVIFDCRWSPPPPGRRRWTRLPRTLG